LNPHSCDVISMLSRIVVLLEAYIDFPCCIYCIV